MLMIVKKRCIISGILAGKLSQESSETDHFLKYKLITVSSAGRTLFLRVVAAP